MNTTKSRYEQIRQLIVEEIDEAFAEDYNPAHADSAESFRDEMIANYIYFLKQDLQSDNA